jgi:hypothetical protein
MRSNREFLKVPFILVEGAPDSVAVIKKLLPDALETTWPRINQALGVARDNRPPGARQLSVFAAYEGKPPAEKLGIKPGTSVTAINPPSGFSGMVSALPEGARLHRSATSTPGLTLGFVRSIEELFREIDAMKPHAASGRLWIIRRKGSAAVGKSALNQKTVRKAGLARGLVDFKISRIDDEWAGLRFTIRK